MKLKLAFIGWRGMVGSVLRNRLIEVNELHFFDLFYFSSSKLSSEDLPRDLKGQEIYSSSNLKLLLQMDIILTTQGSDFTLHTYAALKSENWQGYWIDAASYLRSDSNSMIVLDPVNGDAMKRSLYQGRRSFVGGNCTVSLLLMALHGLFKNNLIEKVSFHSYQAVSGAGAKALSLLVEEMDEQVREIKNEESSGHDSFIDKLSRYSSNWLEKDHISLNLLPWIDVALDNGQTKEEWKAQFEANKILQSTSLIPFDGTCVRVPILRCHSQGILLKLKKSISTKSVEEIISQANPWVRSIPNREDETKKFLTPAYVSGKLEIPIGRLRKSNWGDHFFHAFTVGDQLLWGAAEPLRYALRQVYEFKS